MLGQKVQNQHGTVFTVTGIEWVPTGAGTPVACVTLRDAVGLDVCMPLVTFATNFRPVVP